MKDACCWVCASEAWEAAWRCVLPHLRSQFARMTFHMSRLSHRSAAEAAKTAAGQRRVALCAAVPAAAACRYRRLARTPDRRLPICYLGSPLACHTQRQGAAGQMGGDPTWRLFASKRGLMNAAREAAM